MYQFHLLNWLVFNDFTNYSIHYLVNLRNSVQELANRSLVNRLAEDGNSFDGVESGI